MMLFSKMKGLSIFSSTLFLSQSFCKSNTTEYPYVEVVEYNANNPIEDRHCFTKLQSINGFTASVFDGHGGALTAEYASKNMNQCIDDRIKKNKNEKLTTEKMIQKSLIQAYDDIEKGFFSIFQQNIAKREYKTVGSCALTAVILKDSLHIANAGDCQGILLSDKQAVMTNLRLNAGQKFEQKRLAEKFPEQKDIVVCQSACYVKGRLQPTRSFGDFYLKNKEYNFTNIRVFTGPYIEATPLVTHFKLTSEHKNLILATDGVWDQVDQQYVHKAYSKNHQNLGKYLFNDIIQNILKTNYLKKFEDLDKIQNRRNIHDDITLININLQELKNLL